ncbi:MAG TPA: hypothetical protein VFX39_06425 [Gemmatimonadaceae bacterium]|nr:hypothetical protein [Gemmatimonadaceae bacterium]
MIQSLEKSLAEEADLPLGEGAASVGVAPAGDRDGGPQDLLRGQAWAESREETARVLESLARRIRSGEIALPAGTGVASEAAVLAGLLAALLSRPGTWTNGSTSASEAER